MPTALNRKLHISWLIAGMCIGILAGICGAAVVGANRYITAPFAVIVGAPAVVALAKRNRWMIVLVLIAGCTIGLWRGEIEQVTLLQYRTFIGRNVTIAGTVSDDAATDAGGNQQLNLKDAAINNTPMNGYIWASTDGRATAQRSDRVTLTGKLGFGFGSVAGSVFHAHIAKVVRPQPGDIGLHVRDWFASGTRVAIPEPEADLASGYLVGQRNTLPPDLDAQLKTVGLTHAVVASGYNLTILVSVGRQLLASISKYLATLLSAGLIIGFIMMSGLSPSMARAGLVTSLTLAAWYYGRKIHPFVLLSLAAAATALFNPFYVWGDIGWYLSFSSFAGVIILAPLVQAALWRGKDRPGAVMQIIIDTLSAQAATLPIMLFAFGHYSPYALLANLLVLPLIPLTMLLTFIASIVGLILPALAPLAGLPAGLTLRYMTWMVAHIADLPGAQGDLALDVAAVAGCYVALAAIALFLWRQLRYDFRREPANGKDI
jgi:competence protein ComEC